MNNDTYRVSYINVLDGNRRVLIGQIDRATARSVAANASNKRGNMYMGKGVSIDRDDGTPDGAIVAKLQP